MKRTLALFFVLLFAFEMANGQVIETQPEKTPEQLYDFHILKNKQNKTAAWICLGSGIVMIGAGMAINLGGGILDNDSTNNNEGLWLSYVGAATTLVSIPLFIKAGSHKRKAKLSLKGNSVSFGNIVIEKSNYVSMALTIPF